MLQSIQLHDRRVELLRREVVRDERVIARLSPLEAAALSYLAENADRIVSREELLQEVWGYAPQVRSRAADITMSRLRQNVEADPREPQHILTVRGSGYRFLAPTSAAAPAPAPAPHVWHAPPPLPLPLTGMVGREAELAALQAGSARLTTLLGPPGIGKTRLAVALAAQASGPVWWCALADARTLPDVEEVVASVLGAALSEGGEEPAAQLGHALARRGGGLLVLDNTEQLPDGLGVTVLAWLQAAPQLRVVVTSQRPLGVRGEHRVPLAPLDPAAAGAELLRLRADEVGGALSLEECRQIAAALEGLPLALELAAARSALLSGAELLARLESPLALLRAPRADTPARHASLEAALAWSWALLSPEEHAALACLSVLQGGLTAAAAEAILAPVAAEPLEVLARLVERSLLQPRPGTPRRFEMLLVVGRFAARQLPVLVDAARRRHADYFAAWALTALQHAEVAGMTAFLPRLRAERDNLRAALETDPHGAGPQVALALLEIPPRRQPTRSARSLLAQVLGGTPPPSPEVAGRLWVHRAALDIHEGRLEDAAEALAAPTVAGARAGSMLAVLAGRQQCRLWMRQGRWTDAEVLAARLAAEAGVLGAHELRLLVHLDQAFAAFMRYDLAQTEVLLEEARLLLPALEQTRWGGRLLTLLSAVYRGQGRIREAVAARREALALYRRHDDPINAVSAMLDLCREHFARAGVPEPTLWAEAEALSREIGERTLESTFLEQAAQLAVESGRHAEAEATQRRLWEVSQGAFMEDRRQFHHHMLTTLIRLDQGRLEEARAAAAACRAAVAEGGAPQLSLLAGVASGLSALLSGELAAARRWLEEAAALARTLGAQEEVYARVYLGLCLEAQGEPAAALAVLAEAESRLRPGGEVVFARLCRLGRAWLQRHTAPEALAAVLAELTQGAPPPVACSVDLRLVVRHLQAQPAGVAGQVR